MACSAARVRQCRGARSARCSGDADGLRDTEHDREKIWRYGSFEVHFYNDLACLLFTDYLDPLNAGAGRTIDPWILSDGPLSRVDTLERLSSLGVAYQVLDTGIDLVVRITGGADLSFLYPAEATRARDEWHAISVVPP